MQYTQSTQICKADPGLQNVFLHDNFMEAKDMEYVGRIGHIMLWDR